VWVEPVTLRGNIVALVPLAEEHRGGLTGIAGDPELWRWMSTDASRQARFHEWLDAALAAAEAGTDLPFATCDARTGEPLGSTRYLALAPEHRRLEIGHTWLVRRAWGTGANVEAKLLLLEHAFERLGCRRVEFKTDARNERSRAALAALPARFEGIHRKHMLVRGGESRDSAWYSVVDDEWPEVRAALRSRLERSSG
jgi:N-acetyltransferase